jgi:hypothetical protein
VLRVAKAYYIGVHEGGSRSFVVRPKLTGKWIAPGQPRAGNLTITQTPRRVHVVWSIGGSFDGVLVTRDTQTTLTAAVSDIAETRDGFSWEGTVHLALAKSDPDHLVLTFTTERVAYCPRGGSCGPAPADKAVPPGPPSSARFARSR